MKVALDELIAVYTGRFVCQSGMDGIYNTLGFLTQRDLMTHELPDAADEVRPCVRSRFPSLEFLDVALLDRMVGCHADARAACAEWVEHEKNRLGLLNEYEMQMMGRGDAIP